MIAAGEGDRFPPPAAKRLGNARTICRNCYVHPKILSAYLEGALKPEEVTRARFFATSQHVCGVALGRVLPTVATTRQCAAWATVVF
jgi:DNA topoisomerase IB